MVTDASFANASGGASQGAYGVLCYDEDVATLGSGVGNLIHWKSGKIHRVVNSTLAAETQALSRTVSVYAELTDPKFKLEEWQAAARKRRMHALTKDNPEPVLKKGLCVVDAKSLFDHLVKETVGATEDRRTAIEMQVIRQSQRQERQSAGSLTLRW